MRRKLRRVLALWVLGIAAAALVFETGLRVTPFPEELAASFPGSTEFLDRDGRPLRTMLVDDRRFVRWCALDAISPHLIAATLSAEDKRFRRHPGVDLLAIGRAAWDGVRSDRKVSGASTITQQLIKISRPGERTIGRKLQEIWLALRIERSWSKERILTEYLNRLEYGNLQTGIASASRYYFRKPPADLSIAEAAFLAAIPNAPTRLDPHSNFNATRCRQHWILNRMASDRTLDAAALQRAMEETLRLAPPTREFEAPHFVDLLLQRRGLIPPGGGPVRTTLDLPLNQFVERVLADQLIKIREKHASSGAAVVIDNSTAEVLALAGSGDYFRPGAGQVNGAWAIRSPGSAVKPFTFLLALECGANPCTVVPDVPSEFSTPTGLYRPNNYNHLFHGPVSLRYALGNSLNVAAIRALQLAGGPEALHRRLRDLGITTLGHPAEYYGLGLTLGNGEVRLLELTNAFATIGRLGIHRPYRMLLREGGDFSQGTPVCDARAAYLIADMLSDNSARASAFGLNSFLRFDFPVACKTGTSSDYRDNWTVGTTPEFTVGVWVGNPDGSPMRGITGVTGAAPVLHEVFQYLHQRRGTTWFRQPAGILEANVEPLTGRRVQSPRPGLLREKCLWPPDPECSADRDDEGRLTLPAEYAAWLASPQNTLGDRVAVAGDAGSLRILSPSPGATYILDPDIPASSQRISLRAAGSREIGWSSPTLACEQDGARDLALLKEGRHVISARDMHSGQIVKTWIEVRPQ